MATRGRKPKPTAMKILEGNPGKRPLNENEPVPPKGEIKCPAWLLPEAKKEWKRLAPSLEAMGVLTMADWTAFQGYCQAYARWKEAEQEVSKLGMVYRDGDRIRPNPYIAISRAAFAEVKSLAAEFGLTPANRTAIIANALTVEKSKKELDPMEQILTSTSLDDVIIVEEVNADEEET